MKMFLTFEGFKFEQVPSLERNFITLRGNPSFCFWPKSKCLLLQFCKLHVLLQSTASRGQIDKVCRCTGEDSKRLEEW